MLFSYGNDQAKDKLTSDNKTEWKTLQQRQLLYDVMRNTQI
jgi:hypothetical protein